LAAIAALRAISAAPPRRPWKSHAGTSAFGYETYYVPYRAVAVRQHQHLVARSQAERAQHGVATGRGVLDEGDVLAPGTDEGRQPRRRIPQRAGKDLAHATAGLCFQSAASIGGMTLM
jgi:hypothetical protein